MNKRTVVHPVNVEKPGLTFLEYFEEIHQYLQKGAMSFADAVIRLGEGGPFDAEPKPNFSEDDGGVDPKDIMQIKSHFYTVDERSNRFSLEAKVPAEAEALYKKAQGKVCLVVVFLKQGLVLGVKAPVERVKNGEIFFGEPLRIFKLQRRKDVRWTIGWAYEILLNVAVPREHQGPFLLNRFRLINLSRSGLSFLVESKSQADLIVAGMMLRSLMFAVQGRSFRFDGVVRSKREYKNPKYGTVEGYAIGVEFMRPHKEMAEIIEEIVMSNTAHLLI